MKEQEVLKVSISCDSAKMFCIIERNTLSVETIFPFEFQLDADATKTVRNRLLAVMDGLFWEYTEMCPDGPAEDISVTDIKRETGVDIHPPRGTQVNCHIGTRSIHMVYVLPSNIQLSDEDKRVMRSRMKDAVDMVLAPIYSAYATHCYLSGKMREAYLCDVFGYALKTATTDLVSENTVTAVREALNEEMAAKQNTNA